MASSKLSDIGFEVRSTGHTHGVFVTYTKDGVVQEELVEGGFFSAVAAQRCAREHLQDVVEDAERKAGWDANP